MYETAVVESSLAKMLAISIMVIQAQALSGIQNNRVPAMNQST